MSGRAKVTGPAKERLWVVSELYYPEMTSTGYFLTKIAEGLAEDFQVEVVCGQPSYSERGIRAPSLEERNGTRIHRLLATRFNKDRLLMRAVNILTLSVASFWFALRHFRRGDRILVVTNPPTLPFVIGLAARLRHSVPTLLVHDVYPEILAATGLLEPKSAIYRLLARLFSVTYRMFDQIVVLGRDMAEVVAGKVAGEHHRVHIIPNWGDVDEIRPIPAGENGFRKEYGLEGKFVVQFSGNIGRSHDVELLIDAARRMRDDKHIVFLFVGYGGKSEAVANAVRDSQENLRFLPRQPRERLNQMLAASDATIISFVDGMLGLSVPSRMYNIMASGVPIIAVAHPRSELATTVSAGGAGWVLPTRSADDLAALLRELASAPGHAEARMRGKAGRVLVEEQFTLQRVLEQYREVLAPTTYLRADG